MPVAFLLVALYNKNLTVRGNLLLFTKTLQNQQHYNASDLELFAAYATIRNFRHFVDFQITNCLCMHFIFVASQLFQDEAANELHFRVYDVRQLHGDQKVLPMFHHQLKVNNLKFFQEC